MLVNSILFRITQIFWSFYSISFKISVWTVIMRQFCNTRAVAARPLTRQIRSYAASPRPPVTDHDVARLASKPRHPLTLRDLVR